MTGGGADRSGQGAPLLAGDEFFRGHGLGNDYLVFESVPAQEQRGWEVTPGAVRAICRRGTGVGSDGLIVVERPSGDAAFRVRGFNPDGSEFERSGNGLRVLACYLYGEGLVGREWFRVRSGGSEIPMLVHGVDDEGCDISVKMGRATVGLEAVNADMGRLDPAGRASHPSIGLIEFTAVSIGNPHAVVFEPLPESASLSELGPFLTRHPAFPLGINMQIVRILGADRLQIGVWERGVGRTSGSGTSSCASAVAAVSTGRLQPGSIAVEMEGGTLQVDVGSDLEVTLRGFASDVAEGRLTARFLHSLEKNAETVP